MNFWFQLANDVVFLTCCQQALVSRDEVQFVEVIVRVTKYMLQIVR
jgi:hypothetical protein